MAQSKQKVENLRVLLEQHWDHCRHLESERSWFMNAYAAVIGGVSAFIIGRGVEDLAKLESLLTFKFLVAFLIGFTFFGFFHTVRWTYAFECHRQRVNKLIGWMEPGSTPTIVWKDLDMNIPTMELPLPNLRRVWKSLQKLRKFRQTCSKLLQRSKKFREALDKILVSCSLFCRAYPVRDCFVRLSPVVGNRMFGSCALAWDRILVLKT